ncbi:ribosomal protein L4 domain-containing protein [Pelagophyceae sp. CCMP2097]|nr:ribosomal protein L4 domain-containing protein [Pelagophyceae sp. CCMP2097]
MRFSGLLLVCTSVTAFVAVPAVRRTADVSKTTLGAVALAEVPLKSFAGDALGVEQLQLRATKEGKDMYLVHQKFVKERRDIRAGTASTKTRSEVRGGGRKPYKQKGTGNARRGSTRSPLIAGGGVIFGPKPKNWANKKMNKKEADLAVGISIQNKAARITVVDALCGKMVAPKTKDVCAFLKSLALDAETKTVLVVDEHDAVLEMSTNNMPYLQLRLKHEITVTDMLWAQQVVMTKPAFEYVKGRYA